MELKNKTYYNDTDNIKKYYNNSSIKHRLRKFLRKSPEVNKYMLAFWVAAVQNTSDQGKFALYNHLINARFKILDDIWNKDYFLAPFIESQQVKSILKDNDRKFIIRLSSTQPGYLITTFIDKDGEIKNFNHSIHMDGTISSYFSPNSVVNNIEQLADEIINYLSLPIKSARI